MSNEPDIVIEAFMGHVPHNMIDYITDTLESYDEVIHYLVGMETSPTVGEHMHFIVKSIKSGFYEKFRERVFKRKLALRGRALKNKPRQYGKIRDIKDFEKLASYTVKDQKIKTNMPQDDIDRFVENSHKKFELEGYYLQFLDKIEDFVKTEKVEHEEFKKKSGYYQMHRLDQQRWCAEHPFDLDYPVKLFIIKEMQKVKTESITKGKIDAVWNRWMSKNLSPTEIYYYIYNKRT